MEVDKQRIAELVVKIQSGNQSAFNELYKLTSERAYFVALEFTKNNQDAEDILQESYVKALSKINELDKPESFQSWLNQVVANKSKDFLKKKKPMLFEAEENEVFEVLPDEDTNFRPEENLDQTELQKTVMEVLDELSEEKRACILMMYFEELSVGEIAETLEIPEGTVKTRLFSARKDLKEKFAKRGITSTFSFAPIGVVLWAIRRTSAEVSKGFVTSGASAKVLTGISAVGTGATVAVAGTTAVTTATSAASATTGIAAKIAAMTVAQKVIAGVSVAAVVTGSTVGTVTVVNSNRNKNTELTVHTEEYTTAPSFETTLAVDAFGTVEFSETTELTDLSSVADNSSATKNSAANLQSTTVKANDKSTSASAKQTTTAKQNATTQKQTTTKKATTTKKLTTSTKATTTRKQTTTRKATTTKKQTTATEAQDETTTKKVTTTKPTTTATTEPATQSPATIVITVKDLDNSVVDTLRHTVPAGTKMSSSYLWDLVESEGYSISGVFGSDKGGTAESGKTYSFEAEI